MKTTIASSRTGKPIAAYLALTLLAYAVGARADGPHFGAISFADNKDGDTPQQIFAAETPEIFLRAELVDVPKNAKLAATWIAERSDKDPPNFKVDTSNTNVGMSTTVATFSVPKPSAGWPIGDYRVVLSIDDKPVQQAHFKVAAQP